MQTSNRWRQNKTKKEQKVRDVGKCAIVAVNNKPRKLNYLMEL